MSRYLSLPSRSRCRMDVRGQALACGAAAPSLWKYWGSCSLSQPYWRVGPVPSSLQPVQGGTFKGLSTFHLPLCTLIFSLTSFFSPFSSASSVMLM